MKNHTPRLALVAVTMVLVLVLPGCGGGGGSLTPANYDKIKDGMTLRQVMGIIGRPTDVAPDFNVDDDDDQPERPIELVWRKDSKEVKIGFVKRTVFSKSKKGF